MKENVTILINWVKAEWPRAQEFFKAIGRADLAAGTKEEFGWILEYPIPSPGYDLFAKEGRARGFDWVERRWAVYSESDLLNAPLLLMLTSAKAGRVDDRAGSFDLSEACSVCGTGARLKTPLTLFMSVRDRYKTLGRHKTHVAHEASERSAFVSHELAERLAAAKASGISLSPIVDQEAVESGWKYLETTQVMPRMSLKTRGVTTEHQCGRCGRDGHFEATNAPLEIHYDSKEVHVESLADVVETWEWFGISKINHSPRKGRIMALARPFLLVKPKVYEVFREIGNSKASFVPVALDPPAH
jgi:hypothetical protein